MPVAIQAASTSVGVVAVASSLCSTASFLQVQYWIMRSGWRRERRPPVPVKCFGVHRRFQLCSSGGLGSFAV